MTARSVDRPARSLGFRVRLRFTYAVLIALGLFFVMVYPVHYFIIAPGSAVDLTDRVSVAGHQPPRDRFLLTDVSLRRASLGMLLTRFLPGIKIVPESEIAPPGLSQQTFDRDLALAMDSSQDVAAVVAERAAGLAVRVPPQTVSIVDVLPISKAAAQLRSGDVMEVADGVPIHDVATLAGVLERPRTGDSIGLTLLRQGRFVRVSAKTIVSGGKRKLGVRLKLTQPHASLPVAVNYAMGDIAGSSGGLMFALAIYGSLLDDAPGRAAARTSAPRAIAGTGTLALDGTVGEIEGTQQKLIAAKRAGARIFLVPRANYDDIKGDPDIRIIPVGTFRDALAALRDGGVS